MAPELPEPTIAAATRSANDSTPRQADDTQASFVVRTRSDTAGDDSGALIGNYLLERPLGEGGFGTVWLAEQLQPIRRQVAFKILKLGMNSREVVARFEQERQALAVMDHPGVAKVLDAGITPDGRSFFVMELVDGSPLNHYCDQNHLGLIERLNLFVQVCAAVQHAHQKGLIHRDLKSSNILVAQTDDGPQPKVIDFGIAKAITQPLVEVTLQTQVGQVIGTPAFMSPEQAEGRIQDLDTRTDVYSLGVVLYQLVTGSLPFDLEQIKRGGPEELRRQIVEQVPLRPSLRIQEFPAERQRELGEACGNDSARLVQQIRGDIDWIVLKALEKEPVRRYDSASDFAADIRRFLRREPVVARPPSTSYVLRRFVARHRGAVAAATALLLMLVTGLVVSLTMFFREMQAREEAETSAIHSQQVARIWKDMMAAAGPSKAKGRDASMLKEILVNTAERLDEDLRDQPEVEAELRSVIGVTFEDLGEFELALQQQQRVLELRRQLWGNQDQRLVHTLFDYASTLDYADELEAALVAIEEAVAIDLLHQPVNLKTLARSRTLLSWIKYRQGDLGAAEHEVRLALDYYSSVGAAESENQASAMDTLGTLLLKTARVAESAEYHRKSIELTRSYSGDLDPDIVVSSNNLCHSLIKMGQFDEAEKLARSAVELEERITGEEINSCTDALHKVWAQCLAARKEWDEAIRLLRIAVDAATTMYGPGHRFTNDKRALLAKYQVEAGYLADAAATLEAAREVGWGESAEHSLDVSQALLFLALGDPDQAATSITRAREHYREIMKVPTIEVVEALQVQAKVYVALNQPAEARRLLDEALVIMRPDINADLPLVRELQLARGQLSDMPE